MAINSQKLLSGSTFSIKDKKVSVNQTSKDKQISLALKNNLIKIKTKLIKIDKLLNDNLILQKNIQKINKSKNEKIKFKKQEERLEEKKERQTLKNSFSISQIGAFDRVNRFITYTFIGFLVNKFFKYYPQVIDFVKKIEPVVKFLESFVGNVFKGIVDFIDFGYDTYDKVRAFAKEIGGPNFEKTFDDFSRNLNTFINLAIVAGMATMGGKDFGKPTKCGSKGGKPGQYSGYGGRTLTPAERAAEKTKNARIRKIQRDYGPNAKKIYENALNNGKTPKQAEAAVKKAIKKGVSVRPGADSLAARTAKKGSLFKGGLGKLPSRIATKTFGKVGKTIAGKVFGKIPIIGGLVDFLFALWSGQPVGRAAAKAVGATIGSALGTFIPVPFAGTILGGILGDIVGGALYDTLIGNKPEKPKVEAKAKSTGGSVTTRKSNVFPGGTRTVKRTIRKTTQPPKPVPPQPGKSVGGKEKIQKMFPEPQGQQVGKNMSPYGFLNDTVNSFSDIPFLGSLFNIFGKVIFGDLPSKTDYQNVGLGINAWINNAISLGLLQGNITKAFANGGIIDNNNMTRNISEWVEKSVEELVKNKVTEAINDLKRNLGLKPLQQNINETTLPSEDGDIGSASDAVGGARLLMAAGFPMLAAAILAGNIQQESSWRGQRDPWVLNDDGGTNKGLLSWTSNSGRIANAEKFLGKPLETASNAEQIKWIKEELRQYGLLDEFMDPNRTEDQLKSDSYKYIRWGEEKHRWKYSKQIFAALQRGEQGTYKPPEKGGDKSGGEPGDGKFIQGNSGKSEGIHFHIGPGSYEKGDLKSSKHNASAREVAFKVIKHFLGKKTQTLTRTMASINKNMSDDEIKRLIQTEQIVHSSRGSQGGIDLQVGGAYWPGAKVAFPFAVQNMKYRDGGYGVSAKIAGYDAFVAHGAYDEKGKKAKQDIFNAYKDGGLIQPSRKPSNTKSLQTQASYDQRVLAVLPVIIEKQISMPQQNSSISFIGGGGVNSNDNKSLLFVG